MHTPSFSPFPALRAAALSGVAHLRSGSARIIRSRGKRAALALIAAVALAPAWAQRKPVVVDGELWLRSTPEVRKAFLVGAANMIDLETAYAKKKGTPPPVAGPMAGQALQGMTLDQISNRVTRWYEMNPGRRTLPVLGVVWIDMVSPGAAAGTGAK